MDTRPQRLAWLALAAPLYAWAAIVATMLVATWRKLLAGNIGDLAIFLDSSRQWRRGLPLYALTRTHETGLGQSETLTNLNHPALAILLAPLSALPPAPSLALWTIAGFVAYLAATALASRAVGIAPSPVVAGLALTFPGLAYVLDNGNTTLFLALGMVVAWRWWRGGHETRAGALLGLLVLVKPFLWPLLLLGLAQRRPRIALVGAATALAANAATLPFVGLAAYRDWLAALTTANRLGLANPANVTPLGVLARFVPVPLGVATITGVVLAFAALAATRLAPPCGVCRRDRDLALLTLAALLGSPYVWHYYTPLLLPVIAIVVAALRHWSGTRRTVAIAALVLLWVPYPLSYFLDATITVGMVLLALACLHPVPLPRTLTVAVRLAPRPSDRS